MPTTTASINLHLSSSCPSTSHPPPNLPTLLRTPSGLALLELQGTVNFPSYTTDTTTNTSTEVNTDDNSTYSSPSDDTPQQSAPKNQIGRLIFPDYDPSSTDTAWMRRVYMYVGEHQRLMGEVKKLPMPIAVVRRRVADGGIRERGGDGMEIDGEEREEGLEVVEVVKYKLVFTQRPEPVTGK